MSDPHGTNPPRSDLPRRLDPEAPSSGRSMWPWLAALVVILVLLGLGIGYNRTEQASDKSSAPTTTGAAPSEPPAPPANPGGNASRPAPAIPAPATPAPATPTPNEGPR